MKVLFVAVQIMVSRRVGQALIGESLRERKSSEGIQEATVEKIGACHEFPYVVCLCFLSFGGMFSLDNGIEF